MMDRSGFEALMGRLGAAWNRGDADAAAACFADAVEYVDPRRYRFSSKSELVPFFDPGPSGHSVVWHRTIFDPVASTGVVEFTYVGHHRYHGAAVVEVDASGHIILWREWQHLDDGHEWADHLRGPG